MDTTPASQGTLRDNRLLRWAVVAVILGVAAVVIALIVVRALPDEGRAQVEIAGWRVPVGVVVSTDDVKSDAPGFLLNSLLGRDTVISIDAGRAESVSEDEIRIDSFAGGDSKTYDLTDGTRTLSVRNPLSSARVAEGDSIAVVTAPGSDDALLVLTGVTRAD